MFLKGFDRSATKNELRDALLDMAAERGAELSDAKADKLANKFKQGRFDPDLAYFLDYDDPTGEDASARADRALEGAQP
ncbi:hypothetical protein [Sinomonas sp.]|jgi:hypothetical protein|uniref:hypothetical protein n=1 Tax=Sinomonas sp. TaxID=1914986 RepID=UPI003F7EF588